MMMNSTEQTSPADGERSGPAIRDAPAFDFYPERWLVGVAAMSDAEQIAYLRLLCHQWLLGDAGLPPDAPALKRLAGKGVTEAVLAKLPTGADGKRRNARLEIIRQEQRERIATRRRGAALTNQKRWGERPGGAARGVGAGDRSAGRGRVGEEGVNEGAGDRSAGRGRVGEEGFNEGAGDRSASRGRVAGEGFNEGAGDRSASRGRVGEEGFNEGAGDRSASRGRVAGESPPPTAHLPPPTPFERESSAGAGAGAWACLEEVKAYAPTVLAAPECAESFWNGMESCGWVNKFGQPVSDWKPLFRNFATIWKANVNRHANARLVSPRSDSANSPGRYA